MEKLVGLLIVAIITFLLCVTSGYGTLCLFFAGHYILGTLAACATFFVAFIIFCVFAENVI